MAKLTHTTRTNLFLTACTAVILAIGCEHQKQPPVIVGMKDSVIKPNYSADSAWVNRVGGNIVESDTIDTTHWIVKHSEIRKDSTK